MTDPELRFDAAINPYGCAPSVVAALTEAVQARGYRHYGDIDAGRLRGRLAEHLGVTPASILVYNGAGEAFVWQSLAALMFTRGTLLAPSPSYERFVEVGRRCARAVVEVPLEPPDWRLPLDRFIDEGRRCQARMAMISSPNNPTGNRLVDADSLAALLAALPDCTVVVDEAYAEYTGQTLAPMVARWPNLVVLKTFSKAYGLAGLRVGYLVAHEDRAAEARRSQIPWAVDSLALTAAEAALADQAYLRDVVSRIRRDVAELGAGLRGQPFARVSPTEANFHLVELAGLDWQELAPALGAAGIVVRRRPDMPSHVRITSMKPEANATLLRALAGARKP